MTDTPSPRPGTLVAREALTGLQRDEMFGLLATHFDGVSREQFEQDLADKNWVILIRRDNQLLGFSTLFVQAIEFEGQMLTAIYSGDTIVAPEAWKSPALARAWIAAVNHLRSTSPGLRCYWLLLTSGFRTYRFLPVFWREFLPNCEIAPAQPERRLLEHLAAARYGACFDAASGIVRFPHPQTLRGKLGKIPGGRETDPYVAFFLAKNPGHARGDELVCLAEISEANLTPAGRRMARPLVE